MPAAPGPPVTCSADRLDGIVRAIFAAAGSSDREARLIADHLVAANLSGHDSHGVGMIPAYIHNALAGELRLNQRLALALDAGSVLICDAGQGAGQVMAHDAVARGIRRAASHGSCIVALRDSHHIGRVGHWAEQCAAAGLVSLHLVNVVSEPAVAPFGGTRARLGTNPFAAGIPRKDGRPIIVDFATSRWAVGKVRVAFNKGEPVPPGTLFDATGRPTTDPAALFEDPPGALQTFGEHKGWGLSLACELIAGALTGARTQSGPRSSSAILNSMLSVIVSPERLGTAGPFADSLEAVVSWVQSEMREGRPAVLLPGDPERASREERLRDGIPIDATTWEQVRAAAGEVGLALPHHPEP